MMTLPYMAYVVAEAVHLSGIMSLFVCGMIMSHYARYNITPEAEAVTTHGFHALAFVAEAAVFTYLGADFLLADFDPTAWHSLDKIGMHFNRQMWKFPCFLQFQSETEGILWA